MAEVVPETPNHRLVKSSQSIQTSALTPRPPRPVTHLKSRSFQKDQSPQGPFKGSGPKSRLPRHESVTGDPNVGFGTEMVIVHNKGPVELTLGFDGEDYHYPVGAFVTVSAEIAFHHFGVIALEDRFERPKYAGSQYEERLSGYAPLSLWQRSEKLYNEFIDWFDNGLEFKVFKPETHIQQLDWERIGGEAII